MVEISQHYSMTKLVHFPPPNALQRGNFFTVSGLLLWGDEYQKTKKGIGGDGGLGAKHGGCRAWE